MTLLPGQVSETCDDDADIHVVHETVPELKPAPSIAGIGSGTVWGETERTIVRLGRGLPYRKE